MKRVVCVVLILITLIMPCVSRPVRASGISDFLNDLDDPKIRAMISIINEYVKIGALEAKILQFSNEMSGEFAELGAKASAILASLKAGVAATGISASTAASAMTVLAGVGIIAVTQDWGSYWDSIFNRDDFLTTYKHTNNPLSSWIVNYTHWDDISKSLINMTGVQGDAWDWDYVEMSNSGWQSIYDFFGNIFGNETVGEQSFPAISSLEALTSMDCTFVKSTNNAWSSKAGAGVIYKAAVGTYFYDSVYGQSIYSYYDNSFVPYVVTNYRSPLLTGDLKKDSQRSMQMYIYVCDGTLGNGSTIPDAINAFVYASTDGESRINPLYTTKAAIGINEVSYINKSADIAGAIPNDDGVTRVDLPTVEDSASKSDEHNFYEYAEALRNTDIISPAVPDEPVPDVCPTTISGLISHIQGQISTRPECGPLSQALSNLGTVVGGIEISPADAGTAVGVLTGVDTWVHTGVQTGLWTWVDALTAEIARLMDIYAVDIDVPVSKTIRWSRFWDIAVFDKFPFSIPKDVYSFFESISAPPKEPRFEFDILSASVKQSIGVSDSTIVLDFREFENIRVFVRSCFLILFIVGLIVVTKQYIWTGGG